MPSRSLKYILLAAPLLLGGCGEGWEMQLTNTVFPYGNQRTAGSGVAYVRAQMLPERELNVKQMIEPMLPTEPVVEPVKEEPKMKTADDLFEKKQKK